MSEQNSPFPVYFTPSFPNLYGAQLVACIINTFFFGATFLLALQYFNKHAKTDRLYVKTTVGILVVFATLQSICSAHQSYISFITNFGKPETFNTILFSAPLEFLCSYIASFVAQIFFATRIWVASQHFGIKYRIPVVPVVLLALVQVSSGIAQASLMFQAGTYERLNLKTLSLIKTTSVQGAAAALCDIIITASLCWIFRSHRSGIKRTNTLIEKLQIYAINRAAATSVAVTLEVFLYYFCSGTYYFLIPLLVSTHLYVISVVTVLTQRESLREDLDGSFHISQLVMSNMRPDRSNDTGIGGYSNSTQTAQNLDFDQSGGVVKDKVEDSRSSA